MNLHPWPDKLNYHQVWEGEEHYLGLKGGHDMGEGYILYEGIPGRGQSVTESTNNTNLKSCRFLNTCISCFGCFCGVLDSLEHIEYQNDHLYGQQKW